MKKVLSFVSCALFVAAMAVSCGNKNQEATDSIAEETIENVAEDIQEAAPVATEAMSDADHQAMLNAAVEAGQAKCNCYKTDPASIEACAKSLLEGAYAQYANNDEFKAAMDEAFNSCVKEKATEKAKEVANEGIKAGAKALSEKLGK